MLYLIIIVFLLVILYVAASAQAQKLKRNPDPYLLAELTKPLAGDEVYITREDGTSIHAVTAGSGTIVVLAHGYGYSVDEWNVIGDLLLKAGYRLIAFDLRGHGKSNIGTDGIGSRQMASDYVAILEHFDVRDAILVGHSTGVFLAIVFMLTYPEIAAQRLKGAVLMSGFAGNILKGSLQNRLQIPLIKMGIIQWVARSGTYGWLFGASLCGDNPSPAIIQAFLQGFSAQCHQDLIPILQALADEDYYPRLGEIKLPCVVVCGDKDKTTPRWHSESMGSDIPKARNIWVKGKGHLLNWEAPETLVEVVKSLWNP